MMVFLVCVLNGKSDDFVMGHLLFLQAREIMVYRVSVREAGGPKGNAEDPFEQAEGRGLHELPSNLHGKHLENDHNNSDIHMGLGFLHEAFKNIFLPMELAGIELIPDLKEDEGVEINCHMAQGLVLCTQEQVPIVQEVRQQNQLEDGMGDDVDPHSVGDQRCVLWDRLTCQQTRLAGLLSGKSKGSKGVHDKVQPQQLDRGQRALVGGIKGSPKKSEGNPNDVHSHLKLDELLYVVVHVAAPHDSFHNADEVIIHEDYV
mmetsp:Transcript_100159/g.172974  ORF Transcript_100159/g.172974 Transcript_100159/m.172974 type:complete len:260 (+) Transcript_100159:1293-2072(+)